MREISTKFLEVGEHIVVDGVEYVADENAGDCKDCDLHNCGQCFLIPCQNGVRLKRVEVPTNGGWHTGTPTEDGGYLVTIDENTYDIMTWYCDDGCFYFYGDSVSKNWIKAWQKIEPYKEKS